MRKHQVEIRTKRRHWVFDASKAEVSICAVTPDETGTKLITGKILVKISAEEIRNNPQLHHVWKEFWDVFLGPGG